MSETKKKWTDEAVATLLDTVGAETPVSVARINAAAEALDFSPRSISSKLRKMGHSVESMATVKPPKFTEAESEQLAAFVKQNSGNMTYKDIAAAFAGGKFSTKEVQGKCLALELTAHIKPSDKLTTTRQYNEAEEKVVADMAAKGAYVEDIAKALSKEINSIRGKCLSMVRQGVLERIPPQRDVVGEAVDPIGAMLDEIETLTVADIAKRLDRTERGIKTLLTRRGIDCADYKGSVKHAKALAKREKE